MPPKPDAALESRNPAQFFLENRSIAGFDNPGKSMYTTVREFVENALDAAEECGVFPEVDVTIEKMHDYEINDLYGDKRAKAEGAELAIISQFNEDDASEPEEYGKEDVPVDGGEGAEKPGKAAAKPKAAKKARSNAPSYYRITVKDNGSGMPADQVPTMLGKVLSGTKYTLKQARGRFGLGAKMTLIWAKQTTSKPMEVFTAKPGKPISHFHLDLNIKKNEPNVLLQESIPNDGKYNSRFPAGWHGTEISVAIEGNWSGGRGQSYRWKILKYLQQLAVITPYAKFTLRYVDPSSASKNLSVLYPQSSTTIPAIPREVMHHPSSVDLVVVEDLVNKAAQKDHDIVKFLQTSFSCIKKKSDAEQIVADLGSKYNPDMAVSEISRPQIQHMVSYLTSADRKWAKPDPGALSPAGEYNMFLGVSKEMKPDLIATWSEPPSVYQGHAFIIEAAVSLGGKSVDPGLTVFRFANRIPLLFEENSDVITKTAKELKWSTYKINKATDKIGVYVSIVSTKIPFKGTGKEFVSDEIPEIKASVKRALQNCAAQLKKLLERSQRAQANMERKKNLFKYVSTVCTSVFNVLETVSAEDEDDKPATKRSRSQEGVPTPSTLEDLSKDPLVVEVRRKDITKKTLQDRLRKHVDEFDQAAMLDFTAKMGRQEAKNMDVFTITPLIAHEGKRTVQIAHPLGNFFFLQEVCHAASVPESLQ